jgi:capsular exopolysaccharide synthesis family protein
MQQRTSQQALAPTVTGAETSGRRFLEDFHRYKGIIFRGWRFILICVAAAVTAAVIYIASQKPTYSAASRLLVIKHTGHPVHVGVGNDPSYSEGLYEDFLATQMLLLKSPLIIEQAINLSGLKSVSIPVVIGNLAVKRPDREAKIVDLVYKSKSADQSQRILDGLIQSYKLFLKSNYQKNSNDAITLITRARDELNTELKSLEQAYLEYRQKNPDSTGHTFVTRRLDQWDHALNEFAARSLQLQSQLELGKKMARDGVDPATVVNALSQVGMIGGDSPLGSAAATSSAPNSSTNNGSYTSIARELAEVESRRKTAELYLAHFEREHQESDAAQQVSDQEIQQRFFDDPEVATVRSRLASATQQLADARRVSRSASDHASGLLRARVDALKEQYQSLWEAKRPQIAKSLANALNPELEAGHHAAEAELMTLKARERALRDRLDQVCSEELEKLRTQLDRVRRAHGESDPQVAKLKQSIAKVENRRRDLGDSLAGENSSALIDDMTQNLEWIEAIRSDLQKKFDQDLSLAKKADITLLEESNLRSNLDRQRTLFNSVVDQLKKAQLVSDYDTISMQTIAPISVSVDQTKSVPLLFLAVIVGIGLGSGIAFLADVAEAKVRTLAEIRDLVNLPLIGVIPFIREDQLSAAGTAGLLCHWKPRSALAESYKTTRTNLEFLRRNRRAQVLLVTSPLPGDGKTTTVSNLAITRASTGRRVLLIDGDLRKPALHRMFDVVRHGGLADALLSLETVDRLVHQTFINNLDVLTTGCDVANPAELLASERLAETLKELSLIYDMILIDSSPLLLVTDPSIIGAVADGIILVVKISSTRRHDLDATTEMLKTIGVPVLGVVINGVTHDELGYGYSYGYGYGYGYGRYGYGRYGLEKKNAKPYEPCEEPPLNHNGSSPHDRLMTNGPIGELTRERDPSEPA